MKFAEIFFLENSIQNQEQIGRIDTNRLQSWGQPTGDRPQKQCRDRRSLWWVTGLFDLSCDIARLLVRVLARAQPKRRGSFGHSLWPHPDVKTLLSGFGYRRIRGSDCDSAQIHQKFLCGWVHTKTSLIFSFQFSLRFFRFLITNYKWQLRLSNRSKTKGTLFS